MHDRDNVVGGRSKHGSAQSLSAADIAYLDKRDPNALYCDDPSLTVQASKDETDINLIVARAYNGADISHVNSRVARYGDFSNVPSYQEALDLVSRAEGMFKSLDATVRERFANDPVKMVSFLQDPANYDEAVKLGLVLPKAVEPSEDVKLAQAEDFVAKAKAAKAAKVAKAKVNVNDVEQLLT